MTLRVKPPIGWPGGERITLVGFFFGDRDPAKFCSLTAPHENKTGDDGNDSYLISSISMVGYGLTDALGWAYFYIFPPATFYILLDLKEFKGIWLIIFSLSNLRIYSEYELL